MKLLIAAGIMSLSIVGGSLPVFAEEGGFDPTFNYTDAWNDIHGAGEGIGTKEYGAEGSDTSAGNDELSIEENHYLNGNDESSYAVRKVTDDKKDVSETTSQPGFDREISVFDRVTGAGDADKNDTAGSTVSGSDSSAGNIISGSGNQVGDYISSDVTIGQKNSPDLNIDFSMNGGDSNNTGLFTPDGNLSLVDDLDEQEAAGLQYMTVQTKNGTTFYIIIDRTTDQDNVYFLNPVDAADLMALMDDDTKAKFMTDTEAQAKSNNQKADTGDKTGDTSKKNQNGTNPLATLLIFVVLGGGGAGAYYFFKIKPQKAQVKNDDDDMEFEDDEEYDMENAESDDADEESEAESDDRDDDADDSDDEEDDDLDEEDF